MFDVLMEASPGVLAFLSWMPGLLLMLAGFSVVIFVHELGHFTVAKLAGVRVEKFAIGFGTELFGFTRGETRYSFNVLPLGGYVKMMGQEDVSIDKSGEYKFTSDPRSFVNKSVGRRMWIVSAGVIMNVVFAAFLFMMVFMIGLEQISPVIGLLMPDGPAMRAGLQMGDEIVEINDKKVTDFADIKMAVVLADPHELLTLKYRRGEEVGEVQLRPEPSPRDNLLQIGFSPAFAREIGRIFSQGLEDKEHDLRIGDIIVAADGHPVQDVTQVLLTMLSARGKPVLLKTERPDLARPNAPPKIVEARRRLRLSLLPSTPKDYDTQHLLGLVPLRRVTQVDENERAWLAGFKVGDVILRWDDIYAPTYAQIQESIDEHPNQDIRVQVLRAGEKEIQKLLITPKFVKESIFVVAQPPVGMRLDGIDDVHMIVSRVVASVDGKPTPAAGLGIAQGDRITQVDGQTISSWCQLVEVFISKAGSEVSVTYETRASRSAPAPTPGRRVTKPMKVPHSVGTLIGLPPTARIVSIAGERRKIIHDDEGKPKSYSASSWRGARLILGEHLGETVEVHYRDMIDPAKPKNVKTEIHVTEAMLDPWLLRTHYDDPGIMAMPMLKTIQTSNPVEAMWIGIKKTYYFIAQTYLTMKRMLISQTVGIENISGPVGIMKTGSQLADAGLIKLLYFLAFISANLAVINFLPLPIVDGGLMIFLIIEKIKGEPVSIRTQVVTQIIGLGLIIATFVFVTILDLQKL